MNLKFAKLRPEAKLPVRAHPTDAGMDIFYCCNGDPISKLYNTKEFWIPKRESRVLPTGIKVEVPEGYMLEIKNKSSIASKRQLLVGACVIDSGYDGEILINLHNTGNANQVIKSGEKIAQAVLIPIVCCSVEEAHPDDLNRGSTRAEGGFGSTGRY